jgi:hypothetical protein
LRGIFLYRKFNNTSTVTIIAKEKACTLLMICFRCKRKNTELKHNVNDENIKPKSFVNVLKTEQMTK